MTFAGLQAETQLSVSLCVHCNPGQWQGGQGGFVRRVKNVSPTRTAGFAV